MDSAFPLLCRASYPLIPTSPWETMKVIEAIDMFICISYEFCTLPSGQGSIPAAHIPRSNKLNWFSSRLWGAVEISVVCARRSEYHRDPLRVEPSGNIRVVEVWHVCTLCCRTDYPLAFPSCVPRFVPTTVGVATATTTVSGEYLALPWSAITGLFKSSQPEDPKVARWEEEFTALWMNLWAAERQENREEGERRRDQKNRCDNRR